MDTVGLVVYVCRGIVGVVVSEKFYRGAGLPELGTGAIHDCRDSVGRISSVVKKGLTHATYRLELIR